MPKKLNIILKKELAKKFESIPSGILVNYQGLRSEETYALRKELNSKKIKMTVVKNSVASLAFKELGAKDADLAFAGPVAICTADDPVAVASALVEYRKKNKKSKLEVKGGLLDRRVIAAAEVAKLAALPSKKQLHAQLAGTLAAPLQGLVGVTAGILRKLLYGLQAVAEKKGKEGEGAAAPAA